MSAMDDEAWYAQCMQTWQAARQPAPPPQPAVKPISMAEQARRAGYLPASRGYDCGYTYESYREPPQSYWSNAYQPYSCSQPQSWNYHDKGTYAPNPYFQQLQHQAQRATPPPPPQVHQNPAVNALLKQINEKLDMVATELGEVKAKVEAREVVLQALKLREPPREQVEAITIQSGNAPTDFVTSSHGAEATDPPSPSHERAEATQATEIEGSEEIPVPTVYPPSTETSGRSEEEQCHEHKPFPSYIEIEQDSHVDTCSTHHEEVLVDQVLDELVRLDGNEKAKVLGVLQERKAAPCKKPPRTKEKFKKNRDKVRRARGKRPRAASRMRKSSAPHHTTKVKMKSKCGVDDDKALMLEGEVISSGRCIPKMAYLKHIAREDLFPPPFIP